MVLILHSIFPAEKNHNFLYEEVTQLFAVTQELIDSGTAHCVSFMNGFVLILSLLCIFFFKESFLKHFMTPCALPLGILVYIFYELLVSLPGILFFFF